MRVARALGGDLEAEAMKLSLKRVLVTMGEERDDRRRALHVSDFTGKGFCARKLVARYFAGEGKLGKSRSVTEVQYDGKWREEKWKRRFEAAGTLRHYQLELRRGKLVGHPDFIVDEGRGERVVELTGRDSRQSPILLAMRMAAKKRQCLSYMIMGDYGRGFVLVENKGTNDFDLIPVDRDQEEGDMMVQRWDRVTRLVTAMEQVSSVERARAFRRIPECGGNRCKWCR